MKIKVNPDLGDKGTVHTTYDRNWIQNYCYDNIQNVSFDCCFLSGYWECLQNRFTNDCNDTSNCFCWSFLRNDGSFFGFRNSNYVLNYVYWNFLIIFLYFVLCFSNTLFWRVFSDLSLNWNVRDDINLEPPCFPVRKCLLICYIYYDTLVDNCMLGTINHCTRWVVHDHIGRVLWVDDLFYRISHLWISCGFHFCITVHILEEFSIDGIFFDTVFICFLRNFVDFSIFEWCFYTFYTLNDRFYHSRRRKFVLCHFLDGFVANFNVN